MTFTWVSKYFNDVITFFERGSWLIINLCSCWKPKITFFWWLVSKVVWILATRDTQCGQELALVMQTTQAQRMRSTDSIPMCRLEFVFFHWKCTQVLQKSLSLSVKHACFKRYHHDLLRHLVAFSRFEWFISSDHKIKNFSAHFIHKL